MTWRTLAALRAANRDLISGAHYPQACRLCSQQYLERVGRDPDHPMAGVYSITPKGQQLIQQLDETITN